MPCGQQADARDRHQLGDYRQLLLIARSCFSTRSTRVSISRISWQSSARKGRSVSGTSASAFSTSAHTAGMTWRAPAGMKNPSPEEAVQTVDASGALAHPPRAQSVQRREDLLRHGLDWNRPNVLVAASFQDPLGVCAVCLVAPHVRADVVRRKQKDAMSQAFDPTAPVVRGATRFHHHGGRRSLREEAQELRPGQSLVPPTFPGRSETAISKTAFARSTAMRVSFCMDGLLLAYSAATLAHRCRLSRWRSPSHQ